MTFEKVEAELLYPLALEDSARHYFICYTINNGQTFEGAWKYQVGDSPEVGLFLRKTGIIQIAVKPGFEIATIRQAIETLLKEIPWKQANIPASQASVLEQMSFNLKQYESAKIAICTPEDYKPSSSMKTFDMRMLNESDLDEVIELYKTVFKGFASRTYMSEKLTSGRGRAVGVFIDGVLVSVAQSDYECKESAIIVGVATRLSYQGKGVGRFCFEALSKELIKEGKTLYLQYDSDIAGALYKSVGFKILDKIVHIENKSFTL